MNTHGKIYLITNLVNGNKYVGKTTKTLEQRFIKHCRDAAYPSRRQKTYLNNALAKYGFLNFKIEQLDLAGSAEELAQKETEYILKQNSLYPNGYNLILRDGNLNVVTDLIRQKCSEGGKRAWRNALCDPVKMQKRQEALAKAGALASIKNKQRVGMKMRKDTSSHYVGVYRKKTTNQLGQSYVYWVAIWSENGKPKRKTFKTELEAAKHYDINAQIVYGEKARLNFPVDKPTNSC